MRAHAGALIVFAFQTRGSRASQVWRLLTCHVFMPFGMTFVFFMLFLLKYGANLESEVYRFNPAGA